MKNLLDQKYGCIQDRLRVEEIMILLFISISKWNIKHYKPSNLTRPLSSASGNLLFQNYKTIYHLMIHDNSENSYPFSFLHYLWKLLDYNNHVSISLGQWQWCSSNTPTNIYNNWVRCQSIPVKCCGQFRSLKQPKSKVATSPLNIISDGCMAAIPCMAKPKRRWRNWFSGCA